MGFPMDFASIKVEDKSLILSDLHHVAGSRSRK